MAKPLNEGSSEITIAHIPPQVKRDLINISKNLGITLTGFLKPKLREIADNARPELKKPPTKD